MPKEKWLIDPGELDEYQREIRNIGIDESYIIKGCAGSGKTILALYRANDIRIASMAENVEDIPSFTMVVFTKALRGFIRSGIRQLGIPIRQVVHYDKWDGSEVDYIVVDEAQDFTKEEIDIISGAYLKSIMFYGDTQQQIFAYLKQNVMSVEQISKYLGIPEKELIRNYRLPKLIASMVSHLTSDKDLEKKCVKSGSQKPRIVKKNSWRDELDFIINEVSVRNYLDVGIFLPFNSKINAKRNNDYRNVESVKEYFDLQGFRHEFKMQDANTSNELDFDSDLPKLMTFHNSKGLQFETVFIPFCDYPNHDAWFHNRYINPLYVAMTRTYRNLYITHTERLSPFLKGIPSTKFQ